MAKKPRKKDTNTGIASLLEALKFCAPASKEIGTPNQTHMMLRNQWAIAFDGIVAIGCKIDSDINACPHTATLIKALSKCTDQTQITQLGDGRLSVKSGRFQTFVPCLDDELLAITHPDAPCANINANVINALITVGPVAQENAQRIMLASVMLRAGSAIATDGKILIEAWHGVDLPPILIPKVFINVLAKIQKVPVHFGFSATSATFYFDDQSWIRTQLYSEQWPALDKVLNAPNQQWAIPVGLWEGLAKIADFAGYDKRVHFGPKTVRTDLGIDQGAICEIEGALPDGLILNLKDLQLIGQHATSVDFLADFDKKMCVFHGPNYRAYITHCLPIERKKEPSTIGKNMDDEIPF